MASTTIRETAEPRARVPKPPADVAQIIVKNVPLFPNDTSENHPAGLLNCSLRYGHSDMQLWGSTPLGGSIKGIELYIQGEDNRYHRINLNHKINDNLIKLIAEGPPTARFECTAFISYLNGIPYDFKSFDLNNWDSSAISSLNELMIGDSVMLANHEPSSGSIEPKHFALYIGHGRFLSKWGDQGEIAASNIDAMLETFEASSVVRMRLRQNSLSLHGDQFTDWERALIPRSSQSIESRRQQRFSPADTPPDFNLPEIPWTWRELAEGEYQSRLREFRKLQDELKNIPPIAAGDFNGEHWIRVVSSLCGAFKITDQRPEQIQDLISLDQNFGTRTQPELMIARGVLGKFNPSTKSKFSSIADLEALEKLSLDSIRLNPHNYSNDTIWQPPLRDILGLDKNFLLVLDRSDEQIRVQLVPGTVAALLDPRMFDFYLRLSQENIPAKLHVTGPHSLKDAFLYRFDIRGLTDNAINFFPQYAAKLGDKTSKAITENWEIQTRATGINMSSVDISNGDDYVRISKDARGEITVAVNDERPYQLYTPAFAEFVNKLLDIEKTKINSIVTAEKNLFIKPKEGPFPRPDDDQLFYDSIKEVMKTSVYTKDGIKSERATIYFRELLNPFIGGGAVDLETVAMRFNEISSGRDAGVLSNEQTSIIEQALGRYTVSAIRRGQIGDLRGLDKVMPLMSRCGLSMVAGEADKLRMFYDNLNFGKLMQFCQCFTAWGGFVNPSVNYMAPRTELNQEQLALRDKVRLSEYDHFQLPYFQEGLTKKISALTQQMLPGINVDDDVIREIRKFVEVLNLMYGGNPQLSEIGPEIAIPLVSLLEFTVGIPLPLLREALAPKVKEQIKALEGLKLAYQQTQLN